MGGSSDREVAASEAARTQFDYQKQLSAVSLPAIQGVLADTLRQLGNGGLNQDVHNTFNQARSQLNATYQQVGDADANLIRQQARQSGEVYQPQQINDTIANQAMAYDRQRVQGLRNLQFQEAQAGLGQYNQLMNMLGQGTNAAFNVGKGFSGIQSGAIGGMNNQDPWGGALGGAAAGASAGSTFGPWGTVIGGVAGGALGYFGNGGAGG